MDGINIACLLSMYIYRCEQNKCSLEQYDSWAWTIYFIPIDMKDAADLKVNYFKQPNFQTDNFAQRNWPKMP